MRIDGDWLPDDHGVYEPVIRARLESGTGDWVECVFLVDTGAERTVIAADIVRQLDVPSQPSPRQLQSIWGAVEALTITTRLRLTHQDGGASVVNGPFEGFTTGTEGELSILGRDVLGHFAVIFDRPGNAVTLLTGRHTYTIREA